MSSERRGHCLCGAVRIVVRDPGHELVACHCTMCRRWTGSALVSLPVPEEAMAIEGGGNVRSYASSEFAERCFCGTCGTPLWYRLTAPAAPRDYYITAGLLDDLSGIRLTGEIYVDTRTDAFAYVGPLHQMTEAEVLASLASPQE
ncbi:MAG: GFA family protein [Gemmobacter sp.]|jgi:hypothetical protein|nr:GFA family protein [Gemmobacter sp.]